MLFALDRFKGYRVIVENNKGKGSHVRLATLAVLFWRNESGLPPGPTYKPSDLSNIGNPKRESQIIRRDKAFDRSNNISIRQSAVISYGAANIGAPASSVWKSFLTTGCGLLRSISRMYGRSIAWILPRSDRDVTFYCTLEWKHWAGVYRYRLFLSMSVSYIFEHKTCFYIPVSIS